MKMLLCVAAVAAIAAPAAASAQTAPDGSKAFGIEPYVGVMGGYDVYNERSEFGAGRSGRDPMDGALIEGVAGANVPLGPVFVGAEGDISKGFKDLDWSYGVKGRFGARAGASGLLYVSAGYEWVNGKGSRGYPDRSDWMYGIGVEVGPKDIGLGGITQSAGPRLRLSAETYNFDSIRPMAGVIFHF